MADNEQALIRVAPNPQIQLNKLETGQPYVIVDDFLDDPRSIIASYTSSQDIFSQPLGHPGRGPDLTRDKLDDLHGFIRSKMSRIFPFHRANIRLKAFFSNVALKPEELTVYHRMCHIDPKMENNTHTYAGVIYLFDNPQLGGTGFYRWKNIDLAIKAFQMASKDHAAALKYLEEHSETFRKPPQYMTGTNDIAEFIGSVEPRFNRLAFYHGEIPHSGHIEHPELLNPDPLKGRLTLNFFVSVLPKN